MLGIFHFQFLAGPSRSLKLQLVFDGPKGWAVSTKSPISNDTFLFEYCGEVFTADELYDKDGNMLATDADNQYVFNVNDEKSIVIDAARNGNIARWMNHCCEPNCVVLCYHIGHTYKNFCRPAIFTTRDIAAGEQLTINYDNDFWRKQYSQKKMHCLCNSSVCRFTENVLRKYDKKNWELTTDDANHVIVDDIEFWSSGKLRSVC